MWDVVIVGAGPAATATAITVAQRGLSCLIVDRNRLTRFRPGESLHPGVEPLLRQLGVWDLIKSKGFLRHRGITVQRSGSTHFEPFGSDSGGPWEGIQAWREDFDGILLNQARELGAYTQIPCRAQEICLEQGRVVGITSDAGLHRSRFLVDASGSRHWLARSLHIPIKSYSRRLRAQYGYVTGMCLAAMDSPLFICEDQGWTWIARVRDAVFQWTRVCIGETGGAHGSLRGTVGLNRRSKITPPSDLDGLSDLTFVRTADVTWRLVDRPAGPGFFIVGDAAAVLDPSSSHGVLKALMSGIYAGHVMCQMSSRQIEEAQMSHEYSELITNWFHHDVKELSLRYEHLFPSVRV